MSSTSKSLDWETKVRDAALRISLSPSVKSFFGLEGSPEQWVKLISGWNSKRLEDFMLIVEAEESMQKDLALQIKRKSKVNDTRFLQKIQRLEMQSSHPDN